MNKPLLQYINEKFSCDCTYKGKNIVSSCFSQIKAIRVLKWQKAKSPRISKYIAVLPSSKSHNTCSEHL